MYATLHLWAPRVSISICTFVLVKLVKQGMRRLALQRQYLHFFVRVFFVLVKQVTLSTLSLGASKASNTGTASNTVLVKQVLVKQVTLSFFFTLCLGASRSRQHLHCCTSKASKLSTDTPH
jgi:hypothetical protein